MGADTRIYKIRIFGIDIQQIQIVNLVNCIVKGEQWVIRMVWFVGGKSWLKLSIKVVYTAIIRYKYSQHKFQLNNCNKKQK